MAPLRIALAGTWFPLPSRRHGPANYNLATGYLQAFLQQHADVEVFRKDFPLQLGSTELGSTAVDQILANDPHAVGISSYVWDSEAFARLLPELKKKAPSCRLILGGPTATFGGHEMMQRHPELDCAVLGEGEQTLAELVRAGLQGRELPGVMVREGDQVRWNGPRAIEPELSSLRSPYLSGVLRPTQSHLTLEWSRGCVFRCKHCAWKNFLGGLRHMPVPVIVDEVRWAVEHGYDGAFVLDAAINFDSSRLDEVTAAIAREVPREAIRFSYFLSQYHFEPGQLRSLARLSSHELWVGLESIEAAALRALGRPPLDRGAFESFVQQVGSFRPVHVSIMLGIPGDTLAGFRATVDYVAELSTRLPIASIRVFWTLVPPGSFFEQHRDKFGIRTVEHAMPYLLGSSSFPEQDMREAFRFLYHHPRRELFIYDDPLPSAWLGGLDDLRFHDGGAASIAAAHPSLPASIWTRLIPSCREGGALVAGWVVRSMTLREGWPTLRLDKQDRRVLIQLRNHDPRKPCFVRAGSYDLLWVRDESAPRSDRPDPELTMLMRHVALQLHKEPGG